MTASIFITCPSHPALLLCDDDRAYDAESAEAARTLYAAEFPAVRGKEAFVVLSCELGGCVQRYAVRAATLAEGRALASSHNHGWYVARRARGRLADGCQYHLGTCCVGHARPSSPTLDPNAVLPEKPSGGPARQLDLFEEVA